MGAVLVARGRHLFQEVEGKGVILTLLSGQARFLSLKNKFLCLPGGILYKMPWHLKERKSSNQLLMTNEHQELD